MCSQLYIIISLPELSTWLFLLLREGPKNIQEGGCHFMAFGHIHDKWMSRFCNSCALKKSYFLVYSTPPKHGMHACLTYFEWLLSKHPYKHPGYNLYYTVTVKRENGKWLTRLWWTYFIFQGIRSFKAIILFSFW